MFFDPFGGSGFMFSVMPVFVIIFFIVFIGLIIWQVARGVGQWNRNNNSPILTVEATIVAKRSDVSYYHHNTGAMDNMQTMGHSSTTYYATFEVPSGERMELRVQDNEYGLLAEGDRGQLSFQGTRYLGFLRN